MIYPELVDVFKQTPRNLTGYVVRTTKSNTNYVYHDATNNLVKARIERTAPSGKFFGYAVGQRLYVEVLTKNIDATSNRMRLVVKDKNNGTNVYSPYFFLDNVEYDETMEKSTLIGYDLIAGSDKYNIGKVNITYPITLYDFANQVVTYLGGSLVADFTDVNPVLYEANFDGSESLHTVLAAIAEATGTICFCSQENKIVFKHLNSTIADDSFGPEFYFDFKTQAPITLTKIASVTELNDNYETGTAGYTQLMRENPFLVLSDNLPELVDAIAAKVLGTTMCSYSMKHRGNPCYQPGDCLAVTNVDGETKKIFYINETFEFNGGFVANSEWELAAEENPEAGSTSLGTVLKQTYAKVDKANQQIELVVKETSELQDQASELLVTTEGIIMEVRVMEDNTKTMIESNQEEMTKLAEKVQTAVTAENVSIAVQQELANGVSSVTTTTGFTFDADGLTVEKSGSEMSTQISEDGMKVYRDNTAVLTANNTGVNATNLYATTFIILGETTRFEKYGVGRAGCFWIGN